MPRGQLSPASQSLGPLDPSLQHGLTAISVLAFVSFFASTILFFYLTYKLVWHMYLRPNAPDGGADNVHGGDARKGAAGAGQDAQGRSLQRTIDFALGIDGIFNEHEQQQRAAADQKQQAVESVRRSSRSHSHSNNMQAGISTKRRRGVRGGWSRNPPNQFLILIFNLLLADMHQGVAFFLMAEWLRLDAVDVDSPVCFVQGLFISTGDLASSCFITTIAVHTYLSIVRGYMPPHKVLYGIIGSVWLFVYAISTIPIAATANGAEHGGFFVRAGGWCWMNIEYGSLRLVTHYLFIFIAIAITATLYLAIFIHLRRQASTVGRVQNSISNGGSGASSAVAVTEDSVAQLQLSHNPAFLIYPVIYILCTLPLALGRIASMAGADVPLGYMCFAGAMIASNGSFDCLLFGTTRNVIVFASKHNVDRSDTGLNTFTFMQTPNTRRYGNMVWVQGGGNGRPKGSEDKTTGGWWSWQRLGGGGDSDMAARRNHHRRTGSRSVSQESLHVPAAIQMDTVTSVVVEVEQDKDRDPRFPDPTSSTSPSVNSADKEYPRGL